MTSTKKDPVIVVLQLTGGNDYFNTVIPYNESLYYDNRPALAIPQEEMLKIDSSLAFNPAMAPVKELYDAGKVAADIFSVKCAGSNPVSYTHLKKPTRDLV